MKHEIKLLPGEVVDVGGVRISGLRVGTSTQGDSGPLPCAHLTVEADERPDFVDAKFGHGPRVRDVP